MNTPSYHKSLNELHIGCEPPRAYFIPFDSEASADGHRETSPYFKTLCGEWDFRYFESFEDLPQDLEKNLPDGCDKIEVPSCWQTVAGRGYDVPQYSNERYHFPTDPPYVPETNPCGIYSREFYLEEDFTKRKVFINFEGVASCFYLFINGKSVGYSQVSHCTSELDISEFVHEGTNSITVLVVKWCDGSYLECQDFFRLSGIFREVYLLARSKTRITDVFVRSEVSDDFSYATLTIQAETSRSCEIECKLISPSGEIIAHETATEEMIIVARNPSLWTPETPSLYKLYLTVADEVICLEYGIKRFEISDGVVLLNGKKIKARGINRHDTHPVLGYATPLNHMLEDLYLLKRANVNCIRTSHYPNDPRFLALCSRLGFMVVDEADIETHGMGYDYDKQWDWPRWSSLSDSPEWENAYVDRAARLFERDKNSVCVIMWSLGNEAGVGNNHRAMAQYIKSRDEKAVVHYENSHKEFPCVPEGEDYSDISDVESRMYAGIVYQREYLADKSNTKPFFLCEYVDSITTGDVYANWDVVEESDRHFGGCIWEFADHAVLIESNGEKKYCYGGDFGEYPNDGICCVDGVVYPDRTPRPGYFDMKKVYEPFLIKMCSDNEIEITSKRFFTSMADSSAVWTVESDGKTILQGKIYALDIAPGEKKKYRLFDLSADFCGECVLTVSVRCNEKTEWAEMGYETGFAQFRLLSHERKAALTKTAKLRSDDEERFVTINAGDTEYVFDKVYGRLESIRSEGKQLLAAPLHFNTDRAAEYNSSDMADRWHKAELDNLSQKTYSCTVERADERCVVISADISLGGPSMPPVIRGRASYEFTADGVTVSFDGNVREKAPPLPRFGLRVIMASGSERMEYYGYGPFEAYVDKFRAARKGLFKTSVTDNFEHYICPQENGAHYGSLWGMVGDINGRGLFFTTVDRSEFSFGASHFTAKQLRDTAHDCELVPMKEAVVTLDCAVNASSGNYEIAQIEKDRIFDCKRLKLSFVIKPVSIDNAEPFLM